MAEKKVYDYRCECFKDLPVRGLLHIMILNILLDREMHGAEIHREIKNKFHLEVPKAIIYNLLRRMERNGYLESSWEVGGGGPARRIYRITEKGRKYFETSKNGLRKIKEIINKII